MTVEAFIVIVLAPLIGSFLGVVIDRLPEGRSIIAGRSACDACGHSLGWTDLVPLVSILLLRGSCRYCNSRIDIFYPLVELAAIAVALTATFILSGWLLILSVGLGWSLLGLAVIDHRHLVLPDGLTLPLIPVGLLVAYMIEPGLLQTHIIGGAAGLFAFLGIAWLYQYLRGRDGLGMGDAKLLAGAGAWLGWPALPGVVLLAAVSALCMTFLQILSGDRTATNSELPFGSHLALSFWASWLIGPLTFG